LTYFYPYEWLLFKVFDVIAVHLTVIEDSISEPDYHRHDTPESLQLTQQQHRQQVEAENSSEDLHEVNFDSRGEVSSKIQGCAQ
jgi:hypothetical protein